MRINVLWCRTTFLLAIVIGSSQSTASENMAESGSISAHEAANLMQLPLSCAETEYPNKLNQTLRDNDDLASPKVLHPAFYGCFDWHSAVHGHWSMVRLLKAFPAIEGGERAIAILQQHITPANVAVDLAYFKANSSWERPYGWTWLLKLMTELHTWDNPVAEPLALALKPLAEHLSMMYVAHLPKLVYPIRVGEHTNTAFGLTFAWDYAVLFEDGDLKEAIKQRAQDFYLEDKNCPIGWEPSGYDFLSPCLEELDLMRRVLPEKHFMIWVKDFLPQLLSVKFELAVGEVYDRADGKLVHLDGLNFSRAWVLAALANQYTQFGHLAVVADKHLAYSLPNLVEDSYEGGHWLGSFAINALLP